MSPLASVDICRDCDGPMPCRCQREYGAIPKTKPRWKNRRFLAWVRSLPCSVPDCANREIEAAHFGPRAAGRKVHDCLAVPLCSDHHRDHHQAGRAWVYYEEVQTWQLRVMAAALMSGQDF